MIEKAASFFVSLTMPTLLSWQLIVRLPSRLTTIVKPIVEPVEYGMPVKSLSAMKTPDSERPKCVDSLLSLLLPTSVIRT